MWGIGLDACGRSLIEDEKRERREMGGELCRFGKERG
jgi:hypothetical protein